MNALYSFLFEEIQILLRIIILNQRPVQTPSYNTVSSNEARTVSETNWKTYKTDFNFKLSFKNPKFFFLGKLLLKIPGATIAKFSGG